MPAYIVHSAGERVRFRHHIFAQADKKRQAMEVLKKMDGIAGVKPGSSSLLVFLNPEGHLKAICEKIELAFPELANAESESAIKTGRNRTCSCQKTPANNMKKLELKSLLVSGATTVGLAIFGLHHLHALAGGIFSLFAIQHILQRRHRL